MLFQNQEWKNQKEAKGSSHLAYSPHHPGSVYSFSGSPESPMPTIEELVVAVTPAVTGGVVYILKLFC